MDIKTYDKNHGLLTSEVNKSVRGMYDEIQNIQTWNEYFKWLNMPEQTDTERCAQLIDAVKISKSKGYHK